MAFRAVHDVGEHYVLLYISHISSCYNPDVEFVSKTTILEKFDKFHVCNRNITNLVQGGKTVILVTSKLESLALI